MFEQYMSINPHYHASISVPLMSTQVPWNLPVTLIYSRSKCLLQGVHLTIMYAQPWNLFPFLHDHLSLGKWVQFQSPLSGFFCELTTQFLCAWCLLLSSIASHKSNSFVRVVCQYFDWPFIRTLDRDQILHSSLVIGGYNLETSNLANARLKDLQMSHEQFFLIGDFHFSVEAFNE